MIVVTGRQSKHLHNKRDCSQIKRVDEEKKRPASEPETEILPKCPICHAETRRCEFCNEPYQMNGIGSHERYCSENPEMQRTPVLD